MGDSRLWAVDKNEQAKAKGSGEPAGPALDTRPSGEAGRQSRGRCSRLRGRRDRPGGEVLAELGFRGRKFGSGGQEEGVTGVCKGIPQPLPGA